MPFFRQFPKTVYDFEDRGIDTKIIDLFRFVKVDDAFIDDLSIYTYYRVDTGDRPDVVSSIIYGSPEYYWTFFILNEHLKSGLSGWPMNSIEFENYLTEKYDGLVIQTRPEVIYNDLGEVIEYRNTLASGNTTTFTVGETVTGVLSGATGKVVGINQDLSQLILNEVDGTFLANEVISNNSGHSIGKSLQYAPLENPQSIYLYRDAPHHYEDAEGRIRIPSTVVNESKLLVDGVLVDNTVDSDILPENLTIVTNYEYETALNDARCEIRIVRPESIYDFAKKFKELINA